LRDNSRFEGIRDATVVALDEPEGGKYLAAYVVSDNPVDVEALRRFIRAEKPAYMVPAVTVQLDAIPYNQNQKVNKRALPVPEHKKNAGRMPENDIQQKIFDIVSDVLGHKDFDILSDLFDSGLTSIGTLKVNFQLGKSFNLPVRIGDIKENPTIAKLAEFVANSETENVYQKESDYPLMQNQMGVFVESGTDNSSVRYNIPVLFKLSKKIDIEKLCSAVCKAIDAHPYIKATLISNSEGEIRAVRNDFAEPIVELIELPNLPDNSELVRPFRLLEDRLYRSAIYVTEEGNFLFFDVHHIVADGTSLALLFRDINDAYAGKNSG
jgi:Acyl-CoA synthetases (AMP-forming)/AMP-acid ligases II